MTPANYVLARQLAGLLFLVDLAFYLPWAKVCLGAGYWGPSHRRAVPIVTVAWAAGAAALVLGLYPLIAAAVLWLLFRHYYIANRWKNPFRGGGAPGFMSHWTAMYLVWFELARVLDASGALTGSVRLMCNADFGVILLCSGTYKALSGYLRGEGMEYGLANPFWGYFFGWFKRRRPSHIAFRAQDIWAPVAQISTGVLLLAGIWVPVLRYAGAVLCIASFGYLLPTVRLGRLAVLMMVPALWFLPELGLAMPMPFAHDLPGVATPEPVLAVLAGLTVAFIAVLPIVKIMQYANLFAKRELPRPFQKLFTWYANKVPIIMWRVFTPDVTNFFVRIFVVDRATGARTPLVHEDTTYSYRDLGHLARSIRFLSVTESIALTTVFTTLKYFRSQRQLFEDRLRAYTATLDQPGEILEYEYVAILKGDDAFEYLPVAVFRIDGDAITETPLVPDFDYAAPAKFSHIKETVGYGTYVPLERSTGSASGRSSPP